MHPNDTVREAIDTMTETGVSQLLVLSAEPPVVLGEVVGALHEEALLDLVFSGAGEAHRQGRRASWGSRCRSSA